MATKKQIINDWQKIFPELKKQGSISLDNRLGPLITGIYIKVVRNTYYTDFLCAQFMPGIFEHYYIITMWQ